MGETPGDPDKHARCHHTVRPCRPFALCVCARDAAKCPRSLTMLGDDMKRGLWSCGIEVISRIEVISSRLEGHQHPVSVRECWVSERRLHVQSGSSSAWTLQRKPSDMLEEEL